MELKFAKSVWQRCMASSSASGRVTLEPTEVSKMLRERLKAEFPGTKFSVRMKNYSIRIGWLDKPYTELVNLIADAYSFSDFDGMIDMEYSINRWLLPDGRLVGTVTTGTTGSAGSMPACHTKQPDPLAVRVGSLIKYVFCEHGWSEEYEASLAKEVCKKWGIDYNPDIAVSDHPIPRSLRGNGIWRLTNLMFRHEREMGEKATRERRCGC